MIQDGCRRGHLQKWSLVRPHLTGVLQHGFLIGNSWEISPISHLLKCLPLKQEGGGSGQPYPLGEGIKGAVGCVLMLGST